MSYHDSLLGAFHQLRDAENTLRQNAPRLAKSHLFYTTHGTGEFQVGTAVRFECVFSEKPHFTYGAEIPDDQTLVAGKYPRTHAGVYKWIRENPPRNVYGDPDEDHADDIMYYTGAWVYFVVDIIGGGVVFRPPQPSYTVIHHLSFEGTALKNVPVQGLGG